MDAMGNPERSVERCFEREAKKRVEETFSAVACDIERIARNCVFDFVGDTIRGKVEVEIEIGV